MATYRDVAIVLRTHKLGETDRIITMLARGRGKVRAVAKGVRRTKSRFGSRLEPGMLVDLQCYEGRSLDTVTQAELIAPYGDFIARDYAAYTASAAMLETADRLAEEGQAVIQQFNLLAGGLAALAGQAHSPGLILDSYLLRAVAIAGWAPSFESCAGCGAPGPHRAFNLASGGAVCSSCRTPGSGAPRPETFTLLSALLTADWPVADASAPEVRREATGLVAAYVQWHLERGVRSLRLVDRSETV
ncbi:DNA repair protein RecO [Calidifontibacter sp. DB0510]|uniref:DNA repair protein RecO n=1 Tax=Metallococcus carri TaxID=1656884 RepID=A0A967E8U1_9MICO|nr:DNA repair protein RecO [Metallococcus carri]NHN54169.1 DNA repair protein RecO [Metallococcus carri]NOP36991.1 DNA repair protein RecO [Calidifontibacter sp. DB2511S]